MQHQRMQQHETNRRILLGVFAFLIPGAECLCEHEWNELGDTRLPLFLKLY